MKRMVQMLTLLLIAAVLVGCGTTETPASTATSGTGGTAASPTTAAAATTEATKAPEAASPTTAAATTPEATKASGGELIEIPQAILDGIGRQVRQTLGNSGSDRVWPAVMRKMDRLDPSFRD